MNSQFPIFDGRLPTIKEMLQKTDDSSIIGQLFVPGASRIRATSYEERQNGYNIKNNPYYFTLKPLLLVGIDYHNTGNEVAELKFLDGSTVVEHVIDLKIDYTYYNISFYLLPSGISESIKDKKICITGATKLKRDIYRAIFKYKGSYLANNVNRKTDMLVVASFDDKTSKLKKAEKLGIETISESVLTERLLGA